MKKIGLQFILTIIVLTIYFSTFSSLVKNIVAKVVLQEIQYPREIQRL